MSENKCSRCGATYNSHDYPEHQCPDEEQDDRIAALEDRVTALEEQFAEFVEAFARRHEP
jgi:hypothetical protein